MKKYPAGTLKQILELPPEVRVQFCEVLPNLRMDMDVALNSLEAAGVQGLENYQFENYEFEVDESPEDQERFSDMIMVAALKWLRDKRNKPAKTETSSEQSVDALHLEIARLKGEIELKDAQIRELKRKNPYDYWPWIHTQFTCNSSDKDDLSKFLETFK